MSQTRDSSQLEDVLLQSRLDGLPIETMAAVRAQLGEDSDARMFFELAWSSGLPLGALVSLGAHQIWRDGRHVRLRVEPGRPVLVAHPQAERLLARARAKTSEPIAASPATIAREIKSALESAGQRVARLPRRTRSGRPGRLTACCLLPLFALAAGWLLGPALTLLMRTLAIDERLHGRLHAGGLVLLVVVYAIAQKVMIRRSTAYREPRSRKPARRGLKDLAALLETSVERLAEFAPSYRAAVIPKRRGGTRTLQIPDRETKRLQKKILWRVLERLKVHPAATGFERGRSIVDNARRHVGQAVIVKLDIVDFFPSTLAADVLATFRALGWDEAAAATLTRLMTHEGALPQGAPTSPRLANLLAYGLDLRLERAAARYGGAYSRYADDITISFPRDFPRRVRGVIQHCRRIVAARGYRLHGGRKCTIWRAHQRQLVTGLVVNQGIRLPRETRRWLRAVRHRLATTGQATLTRSQLAGWSALESMVETQGGLVRPRDAGAAPHRAL